MTRDKGASVHQHHMFRCSLFFIANECGFFNSFRPVVKPSLPFPLHQAIKEQHALTKKNCRNVQETQVFVYCFLYIVKW